MKVLALFTCFNRKDKTENCIKTITKNNPDIDFEFVVVNDGSTDGTAEMLNDLSSVYNITILNGQNLYYSGGMRLGMQYIKQNNMIADYFLMLNDDVDFFEKSISNLITQSISQKNSVIVGATADENGNLSYGAINYYKGIKYRTLTCSEWKTPADTFNANCVLIPLSIFKSTPIMDKHYIHSLGDFDYGLSISKNGYAIHSSMEFVGLCNKNSIKGTWLDTSLSVIDRIRKKESPKGCPYKEWWHYLYKNYGFYYALKYTIISYVKLIINL